MVPSLSREWNLTFSACIRFTGSAGRLRPILDALSLTALDDLEGNSTMMSSKGLFDE